MIEIALAQTRPASPPHKSESGTAPAIVLLLLILAAALVGARVGRSWWRQRPDAGTDLLPPQPMLRSNPHTALHDRRYLRAILEAERQAAAHPIPGATSPAGESPAAEGSAASDPLGESPPPAEP